MRRRRWWLAAGAVGVVLAARLPFLAPTLEDVDSVNFDLGVHAYNPAIHQPHPPGYPVYIVLAKVSHAVFSNHATALAVPAAVFSALAVVPLYLLMRQLTTPAGALAAAVFTMFSPLLWFNSVRPMSDLVGFFAVTLVQLLALTSRDRPAAYWYCAAALAGLTAGIRLQSVLLTAPVVCYLMIRERRPWRSTAMAFAAGVLIWAIPLVLFMGGPATAAASFAPVVADTVTADSLLPRWTPRAALVAGRDFLVAPWQHPALAAAMLLLAAAGAALLAWTAPRRLIVPLLLFLPYSAFHCLFQDTGTLRYVIPAIPLVALLASVALTEWRLPSMAAGLATIAFVAAAAATTLPALEAYHSTPSPMMQAVAAATRRAESERVVVAGHFAFERYLPLLPPRVERLPLTHLKEWQSLTEYWSSGRREPVLFLREAHRTDLLQFGRDTQATIGHWEWPVETRSLLQAARPGNIDLMRLDPPRWAIESGAFVTDEAGPYEEVKRQPHRFYVHPSRAPQVLMVSGTVDSGHGPAQLSLDAGGAVSRSWRTPAGPFTFRTLLPPIPSDRYVAFAMHATAPVTITDVWLEAEARPAVRPAEGFFLPERDEEARLYRWIGAEARASAYLPAGAGLLTIEGWVPVDYYRLPMTLSLAWNGRPLAEVHVASERFHEQLRVTRPKDSPWSELTIVSSQSFIPNERSSNGDRRELSARIYQLTLE